MTSINNMVKRIAGLQGTSDVTEWEDEFIGSILAKTQNGADTTSITEKQLAVIERLFEKNFEG